LSTNPHQLYLSNSTFKSQSFHQSYPYQSLFQCKIPLTLQPQLYYSTYDFNSLLVEKQKSILILFMISPLGMPLFFQIYHFVYLKNLFCLKANDTFGLLSMEGYWLPWALIIKLEASFGFSCVLYKVIWFRIYNVETQSDLNLKSK